MLFNLKGISQKYGGCFDDELDAAKSVNQLCKQLGIPEKNPRINGIPNQQWKAKEKTSQYKGIFLHKQTGKWNVGFRLNENKIYGGSFIDELDAARKVNQLCEELGIPERNPGIGKMPLRPQQAKEKTSKYKGVSWSNKQKKWYVRLIANDGKQKYGGSFSDELDAAKKVNQLCAELEIPEKNPGIGTMLHQQWQAREKTSKYKGVSWNKTCGKWYVRLRAADGKLKYGGGFNNELDAAKRVNQLCVELEIPEKNHGIGKMPYHQWQPKEKKSEYKGVYWNKNRRKWCARLYLKGNHIKHGGSFERELDAAKKVNQLCEELGIPLKNPGINKTLNKNIDNQTISSEGANSVCGSEVEKNDDAKAKKRKRMKNFIIDDKSLFNQYYFHENLLK
jgi:hypothetical protein